MSNKHAVKEAPASYQSTPVILGSLDAQSRHSREGGNPLAITENLNLWISATKAKSTSGRGSNKKIELVGIKKLRELILELAVRGKLVPQNPDDEPASELLKKIDAEKAKLIAEGKIKKQKKLPEISEDEKPFELPEAWEWVRLGTINADVHYGYTASANNTITKHRLLRITDIQNDKVNWETVPGCEINDDQAEQYLLRDGDILIARTGGTIGKSYLVSDLTVQSVFASYLIRVRKLVSNHPPYSKVFLGSQLYWSQLLAASMGTGQPNVNGNSLKGLVYPLPPLAEQHRIVAKVDELMALCDQLEQHSEHQLDAHKQLVETLLATLVESENADDLATNWQRLAEHFDTLFSGALTSTTGIGNGGGEWAIDRLKDTILQLAVMGKLVPQNPDDEPASELLKKIDAEKSKLVKEGKIKKPKKLPAVSDDEKPFELPNRWEWVRLGNLIDLQNGYAFKSSEFTKAGIKLLRNINISHGNIDWSETAYISDSRTNEFNQFALSEGDLVLTLDRPLIATGLKWARVTREDLPCLLLQRVAKFELYGSNLATNFLSHWLNSDFFISNIDPGRSNGVPHISTKQVKELSFALPPLAEQQRIVAKVDELFALCDQLKARLQAASETQLTLTEALVEQAIN